MTAAVRAYEHCAADAVAARRETAEHQAKAEFCIAEADRLKAETADYGAKAEFFVAEANRLRRDLNSFRLIATKPKRESGRAKRKRRRGDTTIRRDS